MTIQSIEVYDSNGLLQQGAVSSLNTTSPIGNTGTSANPVIALTGTVGLSHGGTNADLSATGPGFLKQSTSGATVSVATIASGDLTTALTTPPDIGTTTPAKGYFSDLREKIGGFFAIFTHANTADRTYTLPDASGNVVLDTATQTLTNKTLTSPTINTPTITVKDNVFTVEDDADTTKQLQFELSSITTGNTRTLTVPDTSDTIVTLAATQTLTNKSIAASEINSGTLALARGGTGSDLSGTGPGFLKQASSGAVVTNVYPLSDSDVTEALKRAFKAASSTNTTISNPGTSSFDGVTLSSGDRLLLVGQSTGHENGPWIFNGSSSALTRPTDFPSGGTTQAYFGLLFYILPGGTSLGGALYYLSTTGAITIDTTSITIPGAGYNLTFAVGKLGLANGGTAVDLSASGGTHSFLAQDGSHVISARTIATGDLPTVGVAQGGTGQTGAGADDTWLRSNSNDVALTEWALTAQAFSGRLTLSSTLPVSGDIAASTDLYWLPYVGNKVRIPSVNGLDTYLTLGDSGVHLTNSGLLPAYCYDVFGFNNSGSPSAEFLAWNAPTNAAITAITNASPPVVSTGTTPSQDQIVVITGATGAGSANINNIKFRVGTVVASTSFQLLNLDGTNPSAPGVITASTGTWFRYDGAQTRATSLDYNNGVYYKNGAHSRIYLGSVKMDEAGKFNDTSAARRCLWNYFNRKPRHLYFQDATSSWSSGGTLRAMRNTLADRVEFMVGVIEDTVGAQLIISESGSGGDQIVGIGVSSISANSALAYNEAFQVSGNNNFGLATATYKGQATLGYQYLQALEKGSSTLYGTDGGVMQMGFVVEGLF